MRVLAEVERCGHVSEWYWNGRGHLGLPVCGSRPRHLLGAGHPFQRVDNAGKCSCFRALRVGARIGPDRHLFVAGTGTSVSGRCPCFLTVAVYVLKAEEVF